MGIGATGNIIALGELKALKNFKKSKDPRNHREIGVYDKLDLSIGLGCTNGAFLKVGRTGSVLLATSTEDRAGPPYQNWSY
jgi:hypothetical protein